jgi:hypothetical protein
VFLCEVAVQGQGRQDELRVLADEEVEQDRRSASTMASAGRQRPAGAGRHEGYI